MKSRKPRPLLLPTGIVLVLGALAFSFDGKRMYWLWVSHPYVAFFLTGVGLSMIAVHALTGGALNA